jgi:hypothetical protein
MTTFTVSDTWADQGDVEGTVTFTPYPAGVGDPIVAQITDGVLAANLLVGAVVGVQYAVAFTDVMWNGWPAEIGGLAFPAPTTSKTISLRALAPNLQAVIRHPLTPPAAAGSDGWRSFAAATAQSISLSNTPAYLSEIGQEVVMPASGAVVMTWSCWIVAPTPAQIVAYTSFGDEDDVNGQPDQWIFDSTFPSPSGSFRISVTQFIDATPGAQCEIIPQLTSDQVDTQVVIDPSGYPAWSIVEPQY